ncbi:hypothetical protein KIPE111705_07470 [Kibdelosporangium persicum]
MPLRTDFDLVWRGYDREQVQHYVHTAEAEMTILAADRDAAVARTEQLARELDDARAQIDALRARIDRISRTPIPADALSDRLRHMVELANAEAADITARARAAARHSWAMADQADALARQAARRRRELDEQAAQAREQVQADFETAMAARRAEAMRALAEQERAATERAARIVAEAQAEVDRLHAHRAELIEELRAVQRILTDAEPLLTTS